jgi:uncharacterized protein YdhG (YjbR/CyaY superfamily)
MLYNKHMNDHRPKSIDEYITRFPMEVQVVLKKVRHIIRGAAPNATEMISYDMPAFKLQGRPLVYFAAWEKHLGFYATPSGNAAFRKELAPFQGAKGSVRFPFDESIPFDLIEQITKFRVAEITGEKK